MEPKPSFCILLVSRKDGVFIMNLEKRAFLYLTRKKGKNLLPAIVFLLISFSLLTGSSVYLGIRQIAKELRSSIGASFAIRPYEQFHMDDGQVSSSGTPAIDEHAIQRVISTVGKELKCYNTEHSGYVKGENLAFLAGAGHSEESNMGMVKAVRDSSLCQAFLDEEYELIEGEHIKPEDKDKILISKALAQENHLSIGDKIVLTHAKLGSDKGVYTDLIKEKSAYETVEVKGIYRIKNNSDNTLNPTAKKAENLLFSDSQLLIHLQEQKQGIYEGEISFFIADPLHLDKMVKEVKNMDSIDWKNHVINSNDFKYSQIAEQLQGMQKVVIALTMITSSLGLVVLMLILTLRMRGRIQEAGILLAIGKSKQEIMGQFLLEALVLLLLGFWLSVIIFLPLADILNSFLFDSIAQTEIHKNYLQPDFLHFIALFLLESLGVFMTVLVCSGAILRLKLKEILTKMS